jgi:hypothetical protein
MSPWDLYETPTSVDDFKARTDAMVAALRPSSTPRELLELLCKTEPGEQFSDLSELLDDDSYDPAAQGGHVDLRALLQRAAAETSYTARDAVGDSRRIAANVKAWAGPESADWVLADELTDLLDDVEARLGSR